MPRLADVIRDRNISYNAGLGNFCDIGVFGNGFSPKDLGPRKFVPTTEAPGGRYIYCAPTGSGTAATIGSPCSITTASTLAQPGDIVLMRGGAYPFQSGGWVIGCNGNAQNPIIFEPYVGEVVSIDGSSVAPLPGISYLDLTGNFVRLRGFEVHHMPGQGIRVVGADNMIENMHVHHNHLSGVHIQNPADNTLQVTTAQSRNIVRSCDIHDNSDVGFTGSGMGEGENADGVGATQGFDNVFEYNLIYNNSDDGIDVWKSQRSIVRYCISYGNGYGPNGDGNGFKMGAPGWTSDGLIEHCISHNNKARDFDANGSSSVTMRYLTAFGTDVAFNATSDTQIQSCISGTSIVSGTGVQTDNSWQRAGTPAFVSTEPGTDGFLVPTYASLVYPKQSSILRFNFIKNFSPTASNPSAKHIRINNATYSSATEIYISNRNIDSVYVDAYLARAKNGSIVTIVASRYKYIVFALSADAANMTGWIRYTGSIVTSSGDFSDEEIVTLNFN